MAMKKGPVKRGTLTTSMLPMTKAASVRPSTRRGQIVGGLPASFGVKPNGPGRPGKRGGKKMY